MNLVKALKIGVLVTRKSGNTQNGRLGELLRCIIDFREDLLADDWIPIMKDDIIELPMRKKKKVKILK